MCWILILHNLKSSRAAADADWCINFAWCDDCAQNIP
jgi:hypothetical protein